MRERNMGTTILKNQVGKLELEIVYTCQFFLVFYF